MTPKQKVKAIVSTMLVATVTIVLLRAIEKRSVIVSKITNL